MMKHIIRTRESLNSLSEKQSETKEETTEKEEKSTEEYIESERTSCDIEIHSNKFDSEVDLTEANFVKQTLNLNDPKNGVIATIHHTIRIMGGVHRIALKRCCFSMSTSQLVSIDEKGLIFIIDFNRQRRWKHTEKILGVTALVPSITKPDCYLAGTENGHLVVLNIEKPEVQYVHLSQDSIDEISFPGIPKKSNCLALIRTGNEAKLIDLISLTCTHRLQFDKLKMSLKFAHYLPNSEQILTCFMDNSVHLWSTINMDVIRIINPMKMRDKRLEIYETRRFSPISNDNTTKFSIISLDKDLKEGYNKSTSLTTFENCFLKSTGNGQFKLSGSILSYCYTNDGSLLCFSTTDNYLMLISPYTFELIYLIYLKQFNLLQCALLSKPNDGLILGLTNDYKLVLFDYHNVEHKVLIDIGPCHSIQLSSNGKILAVIQNSGELKLWSVEYVIKLLRDQQCYMKSLSKASRKKIPNFMTSLNDFKDNSTILQKNLIIELRKLLRPKRLQQILNEYQSFPAKYRVLIWCTILKIPYNHQQYEDLLNMGVPKIIQEKSFKYPLKNHSLRKALTKCWSNLAQWCKIFAYNDIIPHLIFPFVKIFHHNSMVAFEICLTLIMNQFQLFFEYHPLEPGNYLAMCSNILQYFDSALFEFYTTKNISSSVYAWTILQNCFSEVLDEEQWLTLWDNLLLAPVYQLIFYVVAYNQLQREVILRLPVVENGKFIEQFFHEQNPIDVRKLIRQAQQLCIKCPNAIHPKRYIGSFQPIPNGVYPKFVRYPMKNLQNYEDKIDELEKIRNVIDNQMRKLELEEHDTLHRLENGLQREEHSKRMKTLEDHYQKILKREEEHLNCQRKMLLLYQKKMHQREREAVDIMNKSKDRKNLLRYERQFEKLKYLIERERLHNDTNLLCAEELFNQQKITLKTIKNEEKQQRNYPNLEVKYGKDINKVLYQHNLIKDDLKRMNLPSIDGEKKTVKKEKSCSNFYLDLVERTLNDLENEMTQIITKDQCGEITSQ